MLFLQERNEPSALNEKYFPKSKELLRCEQLIGEIKDIMNTEKVFSTDPKVHPKVVELRNTLRDLFNFKEFLLKIENVPLKGYGQMGALAFANPNAFTLLPGGAGLNPLAGLSNKIVVGSSSYRFEKAVNTCYVEISAIFVRNLAPAETLAIILHEVGHNFYRTNFFVSTARLFFILTEIATFFKVVGRVAQGAADSDVAKTVGQAIQLQLMSMKNTMKAVGTVVFGHLFKVVEKYAGTDALAQLDAMLKSDEDGFVSKVVKSFQSIVTDVTNFLQKPDIQLLQKIYFTANGVAAMIERINLGGMKLSSFFPFLSEVSGAVDFVDMYTNERFADQFAAAHGYGVDLSSAFSNMENTLKRSEFMRATSQRTKDSLDFMLGAASSFAGAYRLVADVHPMSVNRVKQTRENLEKALADETDPDIQRVIRDQIQMVRKIEDSNANKAENVLGLTLIDSVKDIASKVLHLGSEDRLAVIDRANASDGSLRSKAASIFGL